MIHRPISSEEPPPRALILAGGGVRIAYQTGVLWALEEEGISFQHVDGTSGGIFNTAMLASGHSVRKMMDRWRSLPMSYFAAGRPFLEYLRPFRMWGFSDANGIRKKVFPHLGIDILSIRSGAFPANFNLCNFTTKQIEAIPTQEITEDHLIAGISLPMLMPALHIDGSWYMDAAWVKDANLLEEVELGATELWLIWAIGNYPTYMKGAFHQYVHSLEMSANGGLFEELERIKLINRIRKLEGGSEREQVKLHVITPVFPLPLDSELFLQKITTRDLINQGYADGKRYLASRKPEGVPLDHTVTQSEDVGETCSFSGIYSGKLIWDGLPTETVFYAFFKISTTKLQEVAIDLFSSIYFAKLDLEIPLFAKEVSAKPHFGNTFVKVISEMVLSGKVYLVHANWILRGPWYQVVGLDFKDVAIRIFPKDGNSETLVIEGKLFQSFWNRVKASIFTSTKGKDGMRGGIKTRIHLSRKMIQI
ncbi:MAG TPA: patatin-like phospholipase family protein [Lunatimonas sp.]|nr:patatin-like phospholipase family protein [Lunatimonas sp.]